MTYPAHQAHGRKATVYVGERGGNHLVARIIISKLGETQQLITANVKHDIKRTRTEVEAVVTEIRSLKKFETFGAT